MADTLKEDDGDELNIVEVDASGNPIAEEKPAEEKPEEKPAEPTDSEEEDDEDEDARLGDNEEDHDTDSPAEKNRKQRQARKARRERAKAMAEEQMQLMREQNEALVQRIAMLEQHTVGSGAEQLKQQREKLLADARMADDVRAAAISAGNGADVVRAEQIRDQLRGEAHQIEARLNQIEQARQQAQQRPQVTPVQQYGAQWLQANPWYDPKGGDADSTTAKRIDSELVAEGWDPNTPSYWRELTARCSDAFEKGDKPASQPARKGPPVGTRSEHAPPSTRNNEIRVTPERKAAMIEAGVWDDPVRRKQVLKAYRDYDNQSKAQ